MAPPDVFRQLQAGALTQGLWASSNGGARRCSQRRAHPIETGWARRREVIKSRSIRTAATINQSKNSAAAAAAAVGVPAPASVAEMTASKMAAVSAASNVPALCAAVRAATVCIGNGRKRDRRRGQGQRGRAHDEHMFYVVFHLDFLQKRQCDSDREPDPCARCRPR
jgi:hypothetical protein